MKKRFLELIIRSAGLTPREVEHYRTDGCDGQFEIGVGWKGYGDDENGNSVINFATPEGFNDAVAEVLKQIKSKDLKINTDWDFKV